MPCEQSCPSQTQTCDNSWPWCYDESFLLLPLVFYFAFKNCLHCLDHHQVGGSLWFRKVKCTEGILPLFHAATEWGALSRLLCRNGEFSSLGVIAQAVFSTRNTKPLKRKRCYIFDSFCLPLSETIKINMKPSAWSVPIMPFACDFLCSSR